MHKLERILERQIGRLERRLKGLRESSERYSKIRIAIIITGIVLSLGSIELAGDNAKGLAVVPGSVALMVFTVTACLHRRVKRSIIRHEIWREIKIAQLARIRLDWSGIPLAPSTPRNTEHPFEIDLDITGEHSLHQLMDTAISQEGSGRLRSWLLTVEPDRQQILRRQSLVRELAPMTLFREKLILHARYASQARRGRSVREKWEALRLLQWLQRRGPSASVRSTLLFLALLAPVNAVLFTLAIMGIIPVFLTALFCVYMGVVLVKQIEVKKAFTDALSIESTLHELQAQFSHLETWSYVEKPHLAKLCAPFLEPELRPSVHLKRISGIISAMSVRSNPVVWLLLNALVPWDFYFVHRLNRSKAELSASLPVWLDVWFELEALNSVANFRYLNPGYVFPELDAAESPRFTTRRMGHPLIVAGERVCNDFSMNEHLRVALISGSNMAGKSSFLRTLGINLCLAYAGAPVNAESFETSLMRIFACMRINDSVTDGFSYFYAEVKRMKALLTAMEDGGALPLFFLLDEIFRGTNNRERLIGARAYIRALAQLPGVGAIATHDLELVKLADENQAILNYHFREEVQDGRMVFDYKLRSGPCPTTNALKIMEMVGLPTE